jgi:hypothetical protein
MSWNHSSNMVLEQNYDDKGGGTWNTNLMFKINIKQFNMQIFHKEFQVFKISEFNTYIKTIEFNKDNSYKWKS